MGWHPPALLRSSRGFPQPSIAPGLLMTTMTTWASNPSAWLSTAAPGDLPSLGTGMASASSKKTSHVAFHATTPSSWATLPRAHRCPRAQDGLAHSGAHQHGCLQSRPPGVSAPGSMATSLHRPSFLFLQPSARLRAGLGPGVSCLSEAHTQSSCPCPCPPGEEGMGGTSPHSPDLQHCPRGRLGPGRRSSGRAMGTMCRQDLGTTCGLPGGGVHPLELSAPRIRSTGLCGRWGSWGRRLWAPTPWDPRGSCPLLACCIGVGPGVLGTFRTAQGSPRTHEQGPTGVPNRPDLAKRPEPVGGELCQPLPLAFQKKTMSAPPPRFISHFLSVGSPPDRPPLSPPNHHSFPALPPACSAPPPPRPLPNQAVPTPTEWLPLTGLLPRRGRGAVSLPRSLSSPLCHQEAPTPSFNTPPFRTPSSTRNSRPPPPANLAPFGSPPWRAEAGRSSPFNLGRMQFPASGSWRV